MRSDDVDHPDEVAHLDPQPGTDFEDASRVRPANRTCWGTRLHGLPRDTSGGRRVHVYVRIERHWTFTDVRHAAIAFGRELERRPAGQVTTKWWKEERGERVLGQLIQNARDRTIASPTACGPSRARRSRPRGMQEKRSSGVAPDLTVATMPARFAELGDLHAGIDDAATAAPSRCWTSTSATRARA